MLVWLWLAILTGIELLVALAPRWLPNVTGLIPIVIVVLCGLAFIKAGLVGMYFMHLKFERWAFIGIVCFPLALMAFLVCMLLPDVGFG
jgi:cytochrome c oxidase subunit IV